EEDDDMVPRPDLHHINREAAIEDDEDEDTTPVVPQKRAAPAQGGRGRKRQAKNLIETRDRKFLSAFIATAACRRIPWNVFFANKDKGIFLGITTPAGARCCDNCEPTRFPVKIVVFGAPQTFKPRRAAKPSEELSDAVEVALTRWRSRTISTNFSGQRTITGKMLLNDVLINQMAGRARALTDVRIFDANNISWAWGRANNYHYGRQVIDVIGALLMEYPDPQALAREQDAREHAFSQLQTMARGEHHAKLVAIFDACYHAVESQTTEKMITKGRGANRVSEPE
ncbi:hypothetical protein CPB85DRAFT_1168309, partial [Mucidula mucida]